MFRKKSILDKILILLTPFILVIIWFHSGNMLGTGESGLPFYNLNIQLNLLNWAWGEGMLGVPTGIASASKPTFMLLALVEQLGLKGFLLQATLFYLLFVVAGFSTYYFVKKIFPNLPPKYYLLAALFYWFNPISIVNVWNRFLYNYMFFWAQLPLMFLLIYQLLKTRKWLFVLLLNSTFIIFSYVQSAVPFIFLTWLLIIFSFIFYFLTENGESRKFYIKSLFVLVAFYILTNLWWITQFLSFFYSSNFTTTTSLFFSTTSNLATLTGLSQLLGLFSYIFRYFHSSFIESGPVWARVFSFSPLVIFEFIPSLIILWVIFRYRRMKEVIFLGLLFFLTLFLIKGNQPPFGGIFQFLFVNFSSIQVFRNPFEKFGFLLPVAAAPLFVFGVSKLVESTESIFLKRIYFIVSALIVVLLWGFPFWTGLVFTSTNDTDVDKLRSTEIRVPNYYQEANNWLKSQGDNFRFVSLPLGGEGMTYTWEKPYSGVELSTTLFDVSNISFNTSVPYYDKITSTIEKNLLQNNKFIDLLSLLNVKFLVLREDIDWRTRQMRNPQLLKPKLEQLLNKKKIYGDLAIYSVPDEVFGPRIYASDHNVKVEPHMAIEDFLMLKDVKGGALYSDQENIVLPNTNSIVINPSQVNLYQKGSDFDTKLALSKLLYVRYLPDNPLYPFIQLKEKLNRKFSTNDPQERFIYDLTHLGKRVAEVYRLTEKGSKQIYIDKTVSSYIKDLNWIIKEYPERFRDEPSNTSKALIQEEFSKHLIVLDGAKAKSSNLYTVKLEEAIITLRKNMINFGYITLYPILLDSPANKYWVYRFNVPEDGKYTLYLDNNQLNDFYKQSSNIKFQIDDNTSNRNLKFENNLINLGEVSLTEGVHEITIPEPEGINLVQADKEIVLNSKDQGKLQLPVFPFDPFSTYLVSYDYWIRKGGTFHLTVSNDNDIKISSDDKRNYRKSLSDDRYVHDFIHGDVYVFPRGGSSSLDIGFRVDNYNDCRKKEAIFTINCLDKEYKKLFDKETEVVIKNLSVKKIFNNNLHLVQTVSDKKNQVPKISFSKINPSEYKIQISDAKQPYLLVFSELFNSGWKL
ncbi:MAG: hypothetical protein M1308_17390, partial [Actinobacteria bacterium]|nr:hypothetical protein [Actinomycetota bacterium]